jgi:DNA-binding transcriptional regulator YhcF (GntR family)
MSPAPVPAKETCMLKHEKIAQEIDTLISRGEFGSGTLPSMNELARRFSVSYLTMWHAFQELRERGVIATVHGRRSQIVLHGTIDPLPQPAYPTVALSVREYIKARIEKGVYKSRSILPKMDYFRITCSVSKQTVVTALKMLSDEGLIYKKGKHWIVGKKDPLSAIAGGVNNSPEVMVIGEFFNVWAWHNVGSSTFREFVTSFNGEMNDCHVTIKTGFLEKAKTPLMLSGYAELQDYASRLGNRLLGLLMITSKKHLLPTWIDLFKPFKCPLLWFDATLIHGEQENLRDHFSCSRLLRFHRSEIGAARVAMSHLYGHGHRRIGIPVPAISGGIWTQSWVTTRTTELRRAARELDERIELFFTEQDESFWGLNSQPVDETWEDELSILKRIHLEQQAPKEGARSLLESQTPSLAKLIEEYRVTAIISLTDFLAREHLLWLEEAAFRVPGDISLISFDNRSFTQVLNITTIDFCHHQLGYHAAHLLLQDVPVRKGRDGNCTVAPLLVDRGSVGKPRQR